MLFVLRGLLLAAMLLWAGPAHAAGRTSGTAAANTTVKVVHAEAQGIAPLMAPVGLAGATSDWYMLKVWAALKAGDVTAAASAYMSAKGLSEAPPWLQAFQRAFAVANRVAGPCQQVARDIFTGLKNFGGNPQYLRVSSTGGEYLSWQGRVMISSNNFHVAVRQGGRIYDAFTGAAGMTEAEYVVAIMYEGTLVLTAVSAP